MSYAKFNRCLARAASAAYCRAAMVAYGHYKMPGKRLEEISELGQQCQRGGIAIGDAIAASIVDDPAVIRAAADKEPCDA